MSTGRREAVDDPDKPVADLNALTASRGSQRADRPPSTQERTGHRSDRTAVLACRLHDDDDDDDNATFRSLWNVIAVVDHSITSKEDFDAQISQRMVEKYSQIKDEQHRANLVSLDWLSGIVKDSPYDLTLYGAQAELYLRLGFPDLAAGAAYKALLLCDAVREESDEYHDDAFACLRRATQEQSRSTGVELSGAEPSCTGIGSDTVEDDGDADEGDDADLIAYLDLHHQSTTYHLLVQSLLACGCIRSAAVYATRGLQLTPKDAVLANLSNVALKKAAVHFGVTTDELTGSEHKNQTTWPDGGWVRRERYPWNTHEPDRLNELDKLNDLMAEVAPKLEVKAVELPALTDDSDGSVVTQLGVFAAQDLSPGDIVLDETSILTANNKLQDSLCDACSADLPELRIEGGESIVSCENCEVVFCSQRCHDLASESYHPALCERDVEAIAKDAPSTEASDSLYSLLLLRAFAMAETQECHPLDLKEIKYIWGDFHDTASSEICRYPGLDDQDSFLAGFARTLPFSFEYNVRLPFHMLEKMDIDIFANTQYDVWVFNTLYAKFRGTASARLSGLGGRAIRGPEVCAVHPMWCLANHSCDPNVSWEWGGSIRFHVREQRAVWRDHNSEGSVKNSPGIRRGEEVLNHYCDLDLPVKERREWARGALGGDCTCERCLWEA